MALYRQDKFDELRKLVKPTSELARQLLTAADDREKDIALTLDRIKADIDGGNLALASQMLTDLERLTHGGRDIHRIGEYRWQIAIHKDASRLANARELYERYKWLTYTDAEARQAFEKLAADPNAGVYQQLARHELATPDDASMWTYYCELMYKTYLPVWQIDDKAKAGMLRVADIRSGNWPKISALNILQAAGVLARQLDEWTPLFASWTGDYPGPKPQWKYICLPDDKTPPDDWTAVNFDDSKWQTTNGPLGEDDGLQARGIPYIRIAFNCDRTDYKRVLIGIRTRDKAVVYLNGEPVLWSDATQGPRMKMRALVLIDLPPGAIKLLRKGKNVISIRAKGNRADFGMYAIATDSKLGYKPRPKDWSTGPKLAAPELSVKTPSRPVFKSVIAPCTTGLALDVPGKPNIDLTTINTKFKGDNAEGFVCKIPLAERAKYLGHYDPRIRLTAAVSLMAEGAKAVPYIREALHSKDVRVIRGGCDAIAGTFGMRGLGKHNKRSVMTPAITGQLVPDILPLLKHPDAYVREGALLALSNCGAEAAKHLDAVNALADDDEWWVRAAVANVLRYVTEPQTGDNVTETIRNFLAEKSVFGRNRFRDALVEICKRGQACDQIVKALIEETKSENAFNASCAVGALGSIGPNAKAAQYLFDAKLAKAKAQLAKTTDPDKKKQIERTIRDCERTISQMNPSAEPPRKPRKNRKNR